ncbi:unnamed protein product [Miscanthus lutarioriparius]|uniref:Myb-like domain-containing protein n=1 Tax=Miscanthus lutarioriparius TaxID=422564 RepID=A0A811RBY0_9POAL|nr:unnamed protein product [Miscanthus lutarioriparius]
MSRAAVAAGRVAGHGDGVADEEQGGEPRGRGDQEERRRIGLTSPVPRHSPGRGSPTVATQQLRLRAERRRRGSRLLAASRRVPAWMTAPTKFVHYTVHIPPTPERTVAASAESMDAPAPNAYEDGGSAEVRPPQRSYISGTIFTGGINQATRGHVLNTSAASSAAATAAASANMSCKMRGCEMPAFLASGDGDGGPCDCGFMICGECYADCVAAAGNCPGCKEPYSAGSDTDDDDDGEDDEAVSSSEERDQLPLTSMAKRFSIMHSMKIPSNNGGGGKPADFDHARWLFETKGTYGYGNALWPKDGHGGGGGAGFAGFEEPPNFGSRCRRPLTRKTSVSQAILSPYRAVYPPGGFMNFLQRPQFTPHPHIGENFHFVGQTMSLNPISPPPPSVHATVTSQAVKQGTLAKETVIVDNDEGDNSEANRTVNKRYWTHDEEERLASAWLNASKDPVKGNDKKFETFWKEVTDNFNKKGNGKRRREINQLKVHWSRLKSSITDFNDAWTKVTQMYTSGYSDDMLEEEAQKMYETRFGKRFSLVHWWKVLKEEPKWCAQFQETEKEKTEIVDVPEGQCRPIGREAAKAERSGKRKKDNVMDGIVILGDNIDKIIKVQQDRKVECEKVTDAQIQIANANLKAAKEQKEAKMFEVYNSLLNQDTSHMTADQKANREKTLHKLEEKLFAE